MDKRESILRAALTLLVENGIHATPVSLISKTAKTGMGTIYNYFQNKEVLINAIYVKIKNEEKEVLRKVFREELPVKMQFERYYASAINFFRQNPLYFEFMDQLQASPVINEESKQLGYDAIASVTQLLRRGKREQIIKDIGDEEILQFIGGSILGYLRWISRADVTANPDNSLGNQIRLVWDGIKA